MKKKNCNQLELPILTDVSFLDKKGYGKIIASANGKSCAKINLDSKVANKKDEEVYLSISNAYFKAVSLQRK